MSNPGDRWRRSWIVGVLALLVAGGIGIALVAGNSDDGFEVVPGVTSTAVEAAGQTSAIAPSIAEPDPTAVATLPAGSEDPVIGFETGEGKRLVIGGVTASDDEKAAVIAAATAAFPGYEVVTSGLEVNAAVKPILDVETLVGALGEVGEPVSFVRTQGGFVLSGVVPNETARAAVFAAVQGGLGPVGVPVTNNLNVASEVSTSVPGSVSTTDGTTTLAFTTVSPPTTATTPTATTTTTTVANEPSTTLAAEQAAEVIDTINEQIALKGVTFNFGSAVLTTSGRAVLDEVAAQLSAAPGVKVEIGGHTDNTGDRALNLTLSQQRAESVRAYLADKGIAADRMTAKGYGPDKPIADNATSAGRAQNRRIEFTIAPA